MSLADQVRTAQRLAERRGCELYGYEVRDGHVRGMERPKGVGAAEARAEVEEPPTRKVGRGGVPRPVQTELSL